MARTHGRPGIIDNTKDKIYDRLMEMTDGDGPDRCINSVGTESHVGASAYSNVLHEAIVCCWKGGNSFRAG